ncbi:4Fe-4S dicluster domain-containing protein [Lachnospiraceae bacterium C1.1]|nr:4Fe-4S binding protein [Lachnospiraceae bacterium C1.1]
MSLMSFASTSLKNLFKKPVTTKYPFEPAVYPERSRGHIEIVIDDCIGCGMCVRSCPLGALRVDKIKGTWTINRFDCIACGYCVQKCPKKCLTMNPGYQTPDAVKTEAVYTKSAEQLAKEAKQREEAAAKAAAAKKAMEAKKAAEAQAKAAESSN